MRCQASQTALSHYLLACRDNCPTEDELADAKRINQLLENYIRIDWPNTCGIIGGAILSLRVSTLPPNFALHSWGSANFGMNLVTKTAIPTDNLGLFCTFCFVWNLNMNDKTAARAAFNRNTTWYSPSWHCMWLLSSSDTIGDKAPVQGKRRLFFSGFRTRQVYWPWAIHASTQGNCRDAVTRWSRPRAGGVLPPVGYYRNSRATRVLNCNCTLKVW